MKALHQLTNIDKAALLHQMFPQEIPALLQFIESMSQTLIEDQEQQRNNWNNGLLKFDFWLSLAKQAGDKIRRDRNGLHKSHRIFSEQLFEGHMAAFTNHCIVVYTTTRQHPDPKFTLTVDLLYKS